MKSVVGLVLVAALAALFFWRGDVLVVAGPYVDRTLTSVGLKPILAKAEIGPAATTKPAAEKPAAPGGKRRGNEPPRVSTVAATAEDMPIVRRTIGTVVSPASLVVTSETQGLVTEVLARDGADVRKDDVLVRLDSRLAEATLAKDRAALARDQASLEHARNALRRQQSLASTDAVSKQSLDDAAAAVQTAEATVALDEATIRGDEVTLSQKVIRAPFDGRLGEVGVVVGSLVQSTSSIVRLTSLDPLEVSFALAENDVGLVEETRGHGGEVGVVVTPLGSDRAYKGKVDFIDANVDAASGTFMVKATLDSVDGLLFPGQSLAVTATLGTRPVVGVPSVAVQPSQNGAMVYVVGGDGTVSVKPVTVALSDGDRSGVDSGLAAGDRVVVEGQVRLVNGMKVVDASADMSGARAPDGTAADTSTGKTAEAQP
jgi:multidrug efflux system membrane fusion protein